MKKKVLAMFLAVAMVLGILPVVALADNTSASSPMRIQPGQQVTQTVERWNNSNNSSTKLSFYYAFTMPVDGEVVFNGSASFTYLLNLRFHNLNDAIALRLRSDGRDSTQATKLSAGEYILRLDHDSVNRENTFTFSFTAPDAPAQQPTPAPVPTPAPAPTQNVSFSTGTYANDKVIDHWDWTIEFRANNTYTFSFMDNHVREVFDGTWRIEDEYTLYLETQHGTVIVFNIYNEGEIEITGLGDLLGIGEALYGEKLYYRSVSVPAPTPPPSTGGKVYTDYRGNSVTIPGGAEAFAKRVVSFTPGSPWTRDERAMDPQKVLYEPDYDSRADTNYLTLGTGGQIVLEFDVYIVDNPGIDIYVFEIGPAVEATKVEVSNDLTNWIHVGDAQGATSGVDISGKIPAGEKYRYVRLTDLREDRGGSHPGADIDAVAAVNFEAMPAAPQPQPPSGGGQLGGFQNESVNLVGVRLEWNPIPGSIGYRIFRSERQGELGIAATDFYIIGHDFVDVIISEINSSKVQRYMLKYTNGIY